MDRLLTVDPEAIAMLTAASGDAGGAPRTVLSVEVTGVDGNRYTYHLAFVPIDGAGPADRIERHGELAVLVPEHSVEMLAGARLRAAPGGVEIDNPNTPSPRIDQAVGELADPAVPVASRIRRVIDEHINPAIASHGGRAALVRVEGAAAFITMTGGCQGCTLAGVTLAEGIELLVKRAAPEIAEVVDVTDHAAGVDPYFAG